MFAPPVSVMMRDSFVPSDPVSTTKLLATPTTPLVPALLKLKVMAPAPATLVAGLVQPGQMTA